MLSDAPVEFINSTLVYSSRSMNEFLKYLYELYSFLFRNSFITQLKKILVNFLIAQLFSYCLLCSLILGSTNVKNPNLQKEVSVKGKENYMRKILFIKLEK